MAIAIENLNDFALDGNTFFRGRVVDRLEHVAGLVVISTALEREGALSGGWKKVVGVDGGHDRGVEEAGSAEAGEGENDGVEFAATKFLQAGIDVAADGLDRQIGADIEELAAAAKASCADARGGWELLYGSSGERDEHIPGIFTLRNGGGNQISLIHERHGNGNVLEAVNGKIDFGFEEGLFEFLGEQAFATGFVERAIGDAVAGGFDGDEVDLKTGMEPHQLGGDEIALGQGE
jgi:hypothetical protein